MRFICGLWLAAAVALAQPSNVTIAQQAPPAVAGASAVQFGQRGGGTLYYWVIARYPGGYVVPTTASGIVTNSVGAANLSPSNYVRVSWAPVAGATSYDVVRSGSPAFPAAGAGSCGSCSVTLGTTALTADDTGTVGAWPDPGESPASNASLMITINNRDQASGPYMNAALVWRGITTNYRLGLLADGFTVGNCVEIITGGFLGDAGAPCGTGGGGGGGTGLNAPTVTLAGVVLTIGANCTATTPCVVGVGTNRFVMVSGATVTLVSGTGTVYLYIDAAGQLSAGHPVGVSLTCSVGCLAVSGVLTYPFTAIPVYSWDAAGGAWAATGDDGRAALYRPAVEIAGAGIQITRTADTITYESTVAPYDPLDLTTELFDVWIGANDFYPEGYRVSQAAEASECIGLGFAPSGQDPAVATYQTGGVANDYCFAYLAARTRAAGARYADFVSAANFRPFEWVGRQGTNTLTDNMMRFGVFSAANTANPQGVYLEYSSAVGPNWRCVVNDGTATETDTGVAATTANQSLSVSASAAGTLVCSVGATTVQAVDTFPAATFVGYQTQTLTGAARQLALSSGRMQITGLTR